MTPEITLRTFTDDQYILDKIFYANNYRLKNFTEGDNDVCVVDVGAHAGYFSLLCLLRGAKKVYSIEPFADNFRVLYKNLEASFASRTPNNDKSTTKKPVKRITRYKRL